MIGEDRINGYREYTCDCCGIDAHFKSINEARKPGGWGVSYERKYCYCPTCAPKMRHVGRGGIKLNKSGKQLKLRF